MGKTVKEARRIMPRIKGNLLLAFDKPFNAFLSWIRSERDFQDKDQPDVTMRWDLDELAKEVESGENCRRRVIPVKPHLSYVDVSLYVQAIKELRKNQLKLMGIDKVVSCDFSTSIDVGASMRDIKRTYTNLEVRGTLDKAAGSINTLPNKAKLKKLCNTWWNGFQINKIEAHSGLMNLACFGDMLTSLSRADNAVAVTYSDKALISALDFSSHVDVETPVPMTLFLTTSKEGKPNKNNVKDYFTKVVHKDPVTCPVAMEACMIVFRHDVLGIPLPDFTNVEGNRRTGAIIRHWYKDRWLTTLKTANHGSASESCLQDAFTTSSLYQSWNKTFKNLEISSLHVAHIPRVVQSFILSLQGFSHQESGILGKWRAYLDSQSLSYDKLPDGNILSRVAGFESLKAYRPYWFQIQPPDCLMDLVLPMLVEEKEKAKKRLSSAKKAKDEFISKVLHDEQAILTYDYLSMLGRVFICSSPFLKDHYGDHPLFRDHPVFKHESYSTWSKIIKSRAQTMQSLETSTSKVFIDLMDTSTFKVRKLGDMYEVKAFSHNGDMSYLEKHASDLSQVANGSAQRQDVTELEDLKNETSNRRETLDMSYIQTELENKALREENAKLKKVISCFLSGQHQEASKLLDLQNYFLHPQGPSIIEGKVVASDQQQSDQSKPPRKKRKQVRKEKEGGVTHLMPLSSMTMQKLLEMWNNPWVQLGRKSDH